MKNLIIFLIAIFIFSCASEKTHDATVTQTKETQMKLTPQEAFKMLKEGNERFVKGGQLKRDLMKQAKETSKGQYPFAVVLSCLDSRTSAEILFDQGIGDVFSARVAGNIINDDILGSMEFACKVAGAKLIVVLGHTNCGAVKSACDGIKLGNITTLLEKLDTAVSAAKSEGERNSKNKKFVQEVSDLNVKLGIKMIKDKSSILSDMIKNGEVMIVGGMYDLETGKVEFFTE